MSFPLKLNLLLIGAVGVGLLSYGLLRKRKVKTRSTSNSATNVTNIGSTLQKTPEQAVPSPEVASPKAETTGAIIYHDDPEALVEKHPQNFDWWNQQLNSADTEEPVVQTPPSEDAQLELSNLAFVKSLDTRVVPILPGRTICIFGLEYSCTSNQYVYIDGVKMVVSPWDTPQDQHETEKLHAQLSRKIDRIRTETRLVKSRNERTVTADMKIKTRVAPGFQVLIEFTPKDPSIMPGLQAMFVLVDGEGLIIPRSYMTKSRAVWNAEMRVIFTHFLHAADPDSHMSPKLKDQMFHHICGHFTLLGNKLFTDTLSKQNA